MKSTCNGAYAGHILAPVRGSSEGGDIKRAIVILACALALVALPACTPFWVSKTDDAVRPLNSWVNKSKGLIDDVEVGTIKITEFNPPPPPPRPDLREIDTVGVAAGATVESSASRMREGTNLTEREAKSIACYLFGKALEGEVSTSPLALEALAVGYLTGRVVQRIPELKFRANMETLAGAIEDAREGGEEAMKTAMATACSKL